MTFKNLIYSLLIFIAVSNFFIFSIEDPKVETTEISLNKITINDNSPISLKMYDAIIKYADMYNIPRRFAFGIAYQETRYGGPFHWKYNHKQKSHVGAIGPMQIMPATAKLIWKERKFTNDELMSDINFNVESSMKLMRILHNKHKDWKIVFGCYNTGKVLVNQYAINVFNHKINWHI